MKVGRRIKHGLCKTPEYRAWIAMKHRCYNHKTPRFNRYGARGIIVCDRWLNSFENFFVDMGVRPSENHSLDRIDNNGNYEPSNCRWATIKEQNDNKCDSIVLEHNGRRQNVSAWSKELGINHRTLAIRIETGWSIADALETPVERRVWKKKPANPSIYVGEGSRRIRRLKSQEVYDAINKRKEGTQ